MTATEIARGFHRLALFLAAKLYKQALASDKRAVTHELVH
jgi:hypothetical protein